MSEHEFLFALRLPGTGRYDRMVADLAENVLRYVGFAPAAIAELGGELRSAFPLGDGAGAELDVRLQARNGAIEIVVSSGGCPIVHASRRLP